MVSLFPRKGGPADKAQAALEEIKGKLAAAEADQAKLKIAYDDLAYQSALDPSLKAACDRAKAAYEQKCSEVDTLRTALAKAQEIAELELQKHRAARHADQIEKASVKADEGETIALELQQHIGAAVGSFRKLLRSRRDAALSMAGLGGAPAGGAFTATEILELLRFEIHRQGYTPFIGGHRGAVYEAPFPGGQAPSHTVRDNPGAIKPLVDAIRSANAFAKKHLRGETKGTVLNTQPVSENATPQPAPNSEIPEKSGIPKSAAELQVEHRAANPTRKVMLGEERHTSKPENVGG